MCDFGTRTTTTKAADPAWDLARLLEAELRLSCSISTADIRSLIRANWDRLAKLAHEIHDAEKIARDASLLLSVRNILALSEDGLVNLVKGGSPRTLNDFLIVVEAIKLNREYRV